MLLDFFIKVDTHFLGDLDKMLVEMDRMVASFKQGTSKNVEKEKCVKKVGDGKKSRVNFYTMENVFMRVVFSLGLQSQKK